MNPTDMSEEARLEEERKLLENLAKRKKGKPSQRERHGANTWRNWIDGEEDE